MYKVTKRFEICYGHRLINYEGPCKHLHGHNGTIEVTLSSDTLDNKGMVMDFTDLKKLVGTWLKESLDHTFIASRDDKAIGEILTKLGSKGTYLNMNNTTAENLARYIYNKTQGFITDYNAASIKKGEVYHIVEVESVRVHETDGNMAEFS